MTRSFSKAEYKALAQAICEGQWLAYLLVDLHMPLTKPIAIYYDNQSSIHIVANSVFQERAKHIEIDCHVVRDKLQSGVIHLLPIATSNQVANILTKPLGPGPFSSIHSKLGMVDFPTPRLPGGVT